MYSFLRNEFHRSIKRLACIGLLVSAVGAPGVRAETWDSLLTQANAANKSQDHVTAMKLGFEALDAARQAHGDLDSSVALVYHRLGVFNHVAPFDSAIYYYDKAMAIWDTLDPPNPLAEARTLNNLGSAYMKLGLLQKATECLVRALKLKEPLLNENDNSLARAYHNLADLNGELGNYVEAEDYAMHALKIREKILPPGHEDIASTENILGFLSQKRNQWARAEYWYKRAIATGSVSHGHAPPGYANNLAVVWIQEGKFAEAESLYVQLLSDTTVDDQLTDLTRALAWNNLGLAHQNDGHNDLALVEFDSAIAITTGLFGTSHPEYARQICNKGVSLTKLGRLSEAEPLLLQSLSIRQKLLPQYHFDICNGLRGLGWLYRARGDRKQAFEYFDREFKIYFQVVSRFIPYMPQQEALAFSANLQGAAAHCLSVLDGWNDVDAHWRDSVTVSLIYKAKGIVSRELARRSSYLFAANDPQAKGVLNKLAGVQTRMFSLLTSSPAWTAQDVALLDSLELQAQELEEEALTSVRDDEAQPRKEIDVAEVAKKLPDSSVLIEYFAFTAIDSLAAASSQRYLAVVVKPGSHYQVRDLGRSTEADELIGRFREHFLKIDSGDVLPGERELVAYDSIATGLYHYFVAPLESAIGSPKRLFVALDGQAHLISLNCLKDSQGSYLIERWPIQYLGCGSDLIQLASYETSGKGLLAIGDPAFDLNPSPADSVAEGASASSKSPRILTRGPAKSARDGLLTPLPGTRREVQTVSEYWRHVTHEPAELLLGTDASEKRFRESVSGKRVIYVATHGFFEEDSLASRLPFLHCGLYFAGANHRADTSNDRLSNDGIVTAQDILQMDLRGVDLVVLSACESGLGEVADGEGVFGLRRAFQIAGARSVVSSLWRIPDVFTSDMMGPLFEKSAADLMTRIRDLELQQLARMRAQGLPDHPYSWAALISSGDWH